MQAELNTHTHDFVIRTRELLARELVANFERLCGPLPRAARICLHGLARRAIARAEEKIGRHIRRAAAAGELP